MVWVLDSLYEISRKNILDALSELLLMPILKFEHQTALQQFIYIAKGSKYDLSDLLIACSSEAQGCKSVLTFDKKTSKFNLFELVK